MLTREFKKWKKTLQSKRDNNQRFEVWSFSCKGIKSISTELKLLSSKQIIQRLPIPPLQFKAGNNLKSLKTEIRQTVYLSHRGKQIT